LVVGAAAVLGGAEAAPGSPGDRGLQLAPMTKQDADVLEILIGQMAEIRVINAVLVEALGIPPQPEFIQPLSN
jgi:hypothetical protein